MSTMNVDRCMQINRNRHLQSPVSIVNINIEKPDMRKNQPYMSFEEDIKIYTMSLKNYIILLIRYYTKFIIYQKKYIALRNFLQISLIAAFQLKSKYI